MVEFGAFDAVAYGPGAVADPAAVTAPPYDAIDEPARERLHAASPYNIVRLEAASEADEDRYRHARQTFEQWAAAGVLAPVGERGVAVYEQHLPLADGSTHLQRGVLGAVGLHELGDGPVLPHERVYEAPVRDRRQLLEALPVNLSPVFVIHRDADERLSELVADARQRAPWLEFRCEDDILHRVWWCGTDWDRTGGPLAGQRVLLADGHHRTTAAWQHRDSDAGRSQPGAGRILALAVPEGDGPVLEPMHRRIRTLPTDWRTRLQRADLEIQPAEQLLPRGPGPCAHLHTSSGTWMIRPADDTVPVWLEAVPPALRRLDVAFAQSVATGPLAIPEDIDALYYTPDLDGLTQAVATGDADAALLVRPPGVDDVFRAAEEGVRMPPKSTAFVPKPRTGMLMRPLVPWDQLVP